VSKRLWLIPIPLLLLLAAWSVWHSVKSRTQLLRDHGNWKVFLPSNSGLVEEVYVLNGHLCASIQSERRITYNDDVTNWNIFELNSNLGYLEYSGALQSREEAEKQVETTKCDYVAFLKSVTPYFYGNTWAPEDDTKKRSNGSATAAGNCAVADTGDGNTITIYKNCK
jgi:hypothetical protein